MFRVNEENYNVKCRRMIPLKREERGDQFRLMSYNILADSLVIKSEFSEFFYKQYVDWSKRCLRIYK